MTISAQRAALWRRLSVPMSGSSAHAAAARRARFIRARIRISTFVLRVFNRGPPALLRRADGSGCPKRTAEDPALSIPARQPKVRTAVRAEAMRSPRRAKWRHRRVDGDVAVPIPHRPGRADFPHPVLHERDSLAVAYPLAIL